MRLCKRAWTSWSAASNCRTDRHHLRSRTGAQDLSRLPETEFTYCLDPALTAVPLPVRTPSPPALLPPLRHHLLAQHPPPGPCKRPIPATGSPSWPPRHPRRRSRLPRLRPCLRTPPGRRPLRARLLAPRRSNRTKSPGNGPATKSRQLAVCQSRCILCPNLHRQEHPAVPSGYDSRISFSVPVVVIASVFRQENFRSDQNQALAIACSDPRRC